MDDINEVEAKLLIEFRKKIHDIELDELESRDKGLVRWLRARDYNLKKAEEMLRKNEQWKKDYDIPNLLHWNPPREYLEKFVYKIAGYDNENSPVAVCRLGDWDQRSEVERGDVELYLKYLRWISKTFSEHVKELMKENKTKSNQFNLIFDIDGFSFRQVRSIANIEVFIDIVKQFEENYPESLKEAYIININKVFEVGFNIVKPFIPIKTLSKVNVFERNSKKWRSIITSDKFKLDPNLYTFETNEFKEDEDYETITINSGDQLKIDMEVTDIGVNLVWIFKTESHDIGFGIHLNNTSQDCSNPVDIIPIKRILSTRIQRSFYECQQIGKYTFIFDNSYSRFRSKTLHFSICLQNT